MFSRSSSSVSGISREHVAETIHELFERGVDLLALLALFEHAVEGVEHVAHPLDLVVVDVLQRSRHLVEEALDQFLAQLVHQLLELLASLVGHPLVLLQFADRAGQIGRQQIKLHPPLGRHLIGDLLAALVPGRTGWS